MQFSTDKVNETPKELHHGFFTTLQNAHAHLYKNKAVMNVNTLDIYLCPRFYATQLQKSRKPNQETNRHLHPYPNKYEEEKMQQIQLK